MSEKTVEINSAAALRNLIRQQAGDGKILTITLDTGFPDEVYGDAGIVSHVQYVMDGDKNGGLAGASAGADNNGDNRNMDSKHGEAGHGYECLGFYGGGSPRTAGMAVQKAWEGGRADG